MSSPIFVSYIKYVIKLCCHSLNVDRIFILHIPHHFMVWLQSYFTLRSQQVVVDGYCSSSKFAVLSGLHQGSILGPFLILYVNDIFQLPFPQLHLSSIMLMIFSYRVPSNHPLNFQLHNLTLIFSLPGSNLNT